MRVTILTAGSRGDAQPYIALGLGLARAGYDVALATHEMFRDAVQAGGLEFRPLPGDPLAILAAAEPWLASGRNRDALAMFREFVRLWRPLMADLLPSYAEAAAGSDLLVYSAVASPAWSVAESLGIPGIAAFLQPIHSTRTFPSIGLTQTNLGGALNRLTYAIVEQLAWQPNRRQINRWREDELGLPRSPFRGPRARDVPTIYGYSSQVVPRPVDWGPRIHVTGYWVLPTPPAWTPDPALAAFLDAGPAPVIVGFGSLTPRDASGLTAVVLEALDKSGQRGVLLGGWGGLGRASMPPQVFAARDVPHEWLLPRSAAVVHHGGAGTTGAGLRSGVPSIVSPLGFDQPYWAARVEALGVGPRAIPRGRLTATRLAQAISEALANKQMRSHAEGLGRVLRAEDGVARAVEAIGKIANRSRLPQPARVRLVR